MCWRRLQHCGRTVWLLRRVVVTVVLEGNRLHRVGVYLSVKISFALRLAAVACVAVIGNAPTLACRCGSAYPGISRWEKAKLEGDNAKVIFEGVPERFDLQWKALNGKVGEQVSAVNDFGHGFDDGPAMVVTFRLQKAYKGDVGPEIQIKTGLGGGDCGAIYSTGLTYLVFAGELKSGELEVSMCSPGGWVGGSDVGTELRYLRKQRPTPSDSVKIWPWGAKGHAGQEELREQEWKGDQERYSAATGKICGKVLAEEKNNENSGMISFLSSAGYSPLEPTYVSVNLDGSFCSRQLGPGKYYLHFTRGAKGTLTSAVYYPGVGERAEATTIDVVAGETTSGVIFKVPEQKMYAVRGIISTNDKAGLDARNVSVALVRLDGTLYQGTYSQSIDFQSAFPLPRVKYFSFDNVLPGRYLAYISVVGRGWYTHREEVTVTDHMKFISLELLHKN